jgi:hypothetical protein
MLEDLAYAYAETSAVASAIINYIFIIIGGLIGGATDRSQDPLARAPYFGLTGMILAAVSAFSLIEAMVLIAAMKGGFLWVLLVLEFAVLAVAGFATGRIAMARSRDAYGHSGNAALAFIPIANLWLLFTPRPPHRPPVPGREHALAGGAGVFLGLVLSIGSQLTDRAVAASSERRVTAAAAAGELDSVFLPQLLRSVVEAETVPQQVDEITRLTALEAGETTLRYIYAVDPGGQDLSGDLRAVVLRNGCTNPTLRRVIAAGATVTMTYRRTDGTELVSVDLSSQTCPS